MINNKSLRILFLILCLTMFSAAVSADMVEMIVLLDVSESMFPYFDATTDYLLKDIIQEHLKPGDTFHLISFADVPEKEIVRPVKTNEDVEAILDRITLLHPLGQYTDLILSLRYLYQYTADLSLRTKKNILILTDGIHDPPPGSSYPADTEEQIANNKKIAQDIAERFKREGWNINLVEFPQKNGVSNSGESTQPESGMDVYDTLSDSLDVTVLEYNEEKNGTLSHEATGAPSLQFPEDVIRGGKRITVPFKIQNYKNESIFVKLDEIIYDGGNILTAPLQKRIKGNGSSTLRAKIELPEMDKGIHTLGLKLVFSDNLRIFPREGEITYKYSRITFEWLKWAVLIVLGIAVIFLLIRYIVMPVRASIVTSIERESYNRKIRRASKENDQNRAYTSFENKGADRNLVHPQAKGGTAKVNLLSVQPNRKDPNGVPLMESGHRKVENKIPLSALTSNSTSLTSSKEIQHYPIEMRVFGQNPLIGNRNIHWIGQKLHSIGGKGSSFYIFLYKVPSNIANIRFSPGKGFIFTPVNADFFPELNGPLEDCIHKQILLRTEKNEELILIFHEWVSPLERINRILTLTKQTGAVELPSDDY